MYNPNDNNRDLAQQPDPAALTKQQPAVSTTFPKQSTLSFTTKYKSKFVIPNTETLALTTRNESVIAISNTL